MQEQLERIEKRGANPDALNLARVLVMTLSDLMPCCLTLDDDKSISLEWSAYGVYITIEPNLNIEYTSFSQINPGQLDCTRVFSYPSQLEELKTLLHDVLPARKKLYYQKHSLLCTKL